VSLPEVNRGHGSNHRPSTSGAKVKKAKKKEKPKLSFEEDEEDDAPIGSKRSRSPSTGMLPHTAANTSEVLRSRIGTKEAIHEKPKCRYLVPSRQRAGRGRTYRT